MTSPSSSTLKHNLWPYPRLIIHATLVTSGLVLLIIAATWFGNWGPVDRENGPLENTQILILLATIGISAMAVIRAENHAWRYIAIAVGCVAVVGWTREIQSFNADSNLTGLTLPRQWKRVITGSAILTFTASTILVWRSTQGAITKLLHPRFVWPAAIFVSCFVLAELCEENALVVLEESIEVFAYSLMGLTSLWIARNSGETGLLAENQGPASTPDETLQRSLANDSDAPDNRSAA